MTKKTEDYKWYPVITKGEMLKVLRHQGILSWLDIYNIHKDTLRAVEEDILGFVNRACRAVYLQGIINIKKKK